jgi:muramidase (phage lysozyme)
MKILSRRALDKLGTLQANVQELATHRNTALRIFIASRNTTTAMAQREFWLEFTWVDQEYRIAVRRLAQFCTEHQDNSGSRWRAQPA